MATATHTPAFDAARAEAFGDRMAGVLNAGAIAMMTSIGHRTGLFDTMAHLPPSTSEEIARKAGLVERYVREWLGAMVTGGIVEVNESSTHYSLPREHAACLTREARPGNMAATAQWIPLLGAVESRVVECFEQGGGVPYEAYDRFHAVMAEESDQTVVAVLLDVLLPSVPGLVQRLDAGIDALDVGCGRGHALREMARAFPRSRFTGYDFSEEAVADANAAALDDGIGNLRFEAKDVSSLADVDRFDLVTAFDAIHDQAKPDVVLAGIAQALRPDGLFLMQDIAGTSHVHDDKSGPMAPFLYTISCMHCMTVSLAQGGMGLGAMWGRDTATKMLGQAGFGDVVVTELEHDPLNFLYTCRKGA